MKMKKIIVLLILVWLGITLNSCKKKPDEPPVTDYHTARYYSVPQLRALANCSVALVCEKRFKYEDYFTGVVIADHVSGNFYKEIYVRDRYNTGAIRLDLLSSTCNFFIGDSIRMNLKGYDIGINVDTEMLEIDSVDCEKAIVKFASGADPQPIDVILTSRTYKNYLCDLVRIKGVEFTSPNKNAIWSDAILSNSLNRAIKDCSGIGDSILVRTSNYANFAGQKTPTGIGTIVGIATAYGGAIQMAIRTPNEVSMNSTTCISNFYLGKDFNNFSVTSGGWTQQSVLDPGTIWTASTFGGETFGRISGFYSSVNHNSENWLISPSINLSASTNPVLIFETAANYTGNLLEVMISTNYTSGLPATATWVPLSGYNLSPQSGWVWTPSGLISLSGFKTTNTRIAFKYTSTTSASATYEVDDILVMEN